MRAVVRASPAKKEDVLLPKMFLYQVDYGNGPALPYKYRLFAEPGSLSLFLPQAWQGCFLGPGRGRRREDWLF